MVNRYFGNKKINLGNQVLGMKKYFPTFKCSFKRGVVIWIGTIKPTPISEMYKIKIRYSLGSSPEVSVIAPDLVEGPEGERIPHTYSGKKPCLYFPQKREWNKNMLIADSILPWVSLWFYYYEM
jgi:hypothetical protein